ncbi:DUF6254 family protein [Ornithinibacillus californiensis]|nr:DUF6254 family protein [Ornithinibacillus californiensis]
MTRSNREKEREKRSKKNAQNPHGKVKSLDQLAEEAGKNGKL